MEITRKFNRYNLLLTSNKYIELYCFESLHIQLNKYNVEIN